MFPPRTIGRSASLRPLSSTLLPVRWRTARLRPDILPACTLPKEIRIPSRSERIKSPSHRAYTYPENINIFNNGLLHTAAAGYLRVVTTVIAGYGIFWAAPSVIFAPDIPWYFFLAYFTLPLIPAIATGAMFGGYVSHINVLLPVQARRSKEDLRRFASRVAPGTTVQIKSLWFSPWPHTREIAFRDLRRLPKSRLRLSNLEEQQGSSGDLRSSTWDQIARSWKGRYHVRRDQVKDRSRVSGVWNAMWEQIPMIEVETGEAKKPIGPTNRDERTPANAGRKPPSPLSPSARLKP